MRKTFVGAALAAALTALAFTSDHSVPAAPGHHTPNAIEDRSLLLTVQIDALGVRVLQATEKPELRYRKKRTAATAPFRWILRDANGKAMDRGGFDPGPMDLDPRHRGRVGAVRGDYLIPTETATNVKVPALPFHSIDFFVEKGGKLVPFGTAVAGHFPVRGG